MWPQKKDISLPKDKSKPIGLLAGEGYLPEMLAQSIQSHGYPFVVVSVDRAQSNAFKACAARMEMFSLNEAQKALDFVKKNGVKHILLAGKINKKKIYNQDFKPDALWNSTYQGVGQSRGDDRILRGVEAVLKLNGIQLSNPIAWLRDHVADTGIMTQRPLTETQKKDIQFGKHIAKKIGALDIGQMVVVKDGCVLAVEAIEGTDQVLSRLKELAITGAVVVKVTKPQQKMDLDLPVIGMDTLRTAKAASCAVIACEAGRTLLLNKQQLIQEANRIDISLVGC